MDEKGETNKIIVTFDDLDDDFEICSAKKCDEELTEAEAFKPENNGEEISENRLSKDSGGSENGEAATSEAMPAAQATKQTAGQAAIQAAEQGEKQKQATTQAENQKQATPQATKQGENQNQTSAQKQTTAQNQAAVQQREAAQNQTDGRMALKSSGLPKNRSFFEVRKPKRVRETEEKIARIKRNTDSFWSKESKNAGEDERLRTQNLRSRKKISDSKERLSKHRKRAEERTEAAEYLLKKQETYYAAGTALLGMAVLVVLTVIAGSSINKTVTDRAVEYYAGTAETTGDGTLLFNVSDAYRNFVIYNEKAKSTTVEDSYGTTTPAVTKSPEETENPESTPELPEETEKVTEITENSPAEEATETPGTIIGKLVPATGEKYYVFDLTAEGIAARLLSPGDYYTGGVGSDTATAELKVGSKGYDLDYGVLRIQNPYDCTGFDLRSLLESPLIIRGRAVTSENIIIYYTHTSEGYCTAEEERTIKTAASVSGYDTARNIVGRGTTLAKYAEASGVGVINCTNENDEDYNEAYNKSADTVAKLLDAHNSVSLLLDLHVNAFEYPSGKRYAPVAVKNGENYAKVLFVVTQNDETNPNWRENVKLAMLIISKISEKVPGISLGISLRNEAKYNLTGADNGLLIEIGFEGNLVEEADRTAAVIGEAIGEIYG